MPRAAEVKVSPSLIINLAAMPDGQYQDEQLRFLGFIKDAPVASAIRVTITEQC